MASLSTKDDHCSCRIEDCLRLIDPILQFLTRATDQDRVPLSLIRKAIPSNHLSESNSLIDDLRTICSHGILELHRSADNKVHEEVTASFDDANLACIQWEDVTLSLGFPLPSPHHKWHGSGKTAAKRRLTALQQILQKNYPVPPLGDQNPGEMNKNLSAASSEDRPVSPPQFERRKLSTPEGILEPEDESDNPLQRNDIPRDAMEALQKLLAFPSTGNLSSNDDNILPRQVSYAGSTPAQDSVFAAWPGASKIPPTLIRALGLEKRPLYSHQISAVEASLNGIDCIVCTGTGSGKSLCYLLPALTVAYKSNQTSLLLFPTKALAQDQLTKLMAFVASDDDLRQRIRPATLDGDTSFSARSRIHECNIILTNPDILHTSVLPAWKTTSYQTMFASLRYVAMDEAHMYDGVFGAHVAMILRRLVRIAVVAALSNPNVAPSSPYIRPSAPPTFIATSATLLWPAEHFRLLCPIGPDRPIHVVSKDGSPRSAKHFFVWNPPVLHMDGTSTGKVFYPSAKQQDSRNNVSLNNGNRKRRLAKSVEHSSLGESLDCKDIVSPLFLESDMEADNVRSWTAQPFERRPMYRRRHAAEETARLLARAVVNGVRCIAFCKTRNLVEWVYDKALDALKSNPDTAKLSDLVESYRGGYSVAERRKIEDRLFHNNILAVVGTNALELGVDIGGIDLTLHCGYPSSYASLLQQAGRAGRGKGRQSSVSVVVCFNSPSEQQMWRRPLSLLSKGPSSSISIPLRDDLMQGHLLCASEEFPLSKTGPFGAIAGAHSSTSYRNISDEQLFGDEYNNAMTLLMSKNYVIEETIPNSIDPHKSHTVFKGRPSFRKACSKLSIRSIEPISYSIVDLSHPMQRGRNDDHFDAAAVLDTLPYSRVFYHAYPGAIITHRGKKYEIVSMTQPPAFSNENFCFRRSVQLAAYVRPTKVRYFTRPLSKTTITVIKQLETVEIVEISKEEYSPESNDTANQMNLHGITFAGCGALSIKRQVRGYKKMSTVNYSEISRTELSLPPFEYDTFGLYICADPSSLLGLLGECYGPGIHALSHALCTVAPLFADGLTVSDVDCDHAFYAPTRVTIFDQRAGGSGSVQRLWKCFFREQNNILEAAIDLLNNCSSCHSDSSYDGGCPACIHASQCLIFNAHLSRSAAITIGERMLERLKSTDLYKSTAALDTEEAFLCMKAEVDTTPRRRARHQAMQHAKELNSARDRQYVVGRVTWPLDQQQHDRLEHGT